MVGCRSSGRRPILNLSYRLAIKVDGLRLILQCRWGRRGGFVQRDCELGKRISRGTRPMLLCSSGAGGEAQRVGRQPGTNRISSARPGSFLRRAARCQEPPDRTAPGRAATAATRPARGSVWAFTALNTCCAFSCPTAAVYSSGPSPAARPPYPRPAREHPDRPPVVPLQIPRQVVGLDWSQRRDEREPPRLDLRGSISRVVDQPGRGGGAPRPLPGEHPRVGQPQDQLCHRPGRGCVERFVVGWLSHAERREQLGHRLDQPERALFHADGDRLLREPQPQGRVLMPGSSTGTTR